MKARELRTPAVLWVVIVVIALRIHWDVAQGGAYVAMIHNDHRALAGLSLRVQERVRSSEESFELAMDMGSVQKADEVDPTAPPPKPIVKKEEKEKDKANPEAKKDAPKKEEEKKIEIAVKKEENKVTPPPKLLEDKRIAVKQHAEEKQEDNPNARFVADQANHVEKETVATQTSHDQDDPNPTPGGNHPGAEKKMGDADKTKIAESEEHDGEKNRAPGEKGTEFEVQHEPPPERPMGPVAVVAPPSQVPPATGGDNRAQQAPQVAPTPEQAPGQQAQNSPDVMSGQGDWSFNPIRPGATSGLTTHPGPGQGNPNDKTRSAAPQVQVLGLGGRAGPGQVNFNLNQQGVVAVVGQDQLRKERLADGERRKSEHRGSWVASSFERWRSAIENYVSSVKPGNTTALNTAAVPFASYLNSMHNRIHPIFADSFLGSLDSLPSGHAMNDQKLMTKLEIVLTREGQLHHMGVVKTSGITAFDIAALDSVQRASPFGAAPSAIISPDGRVYLHWEFHRDDYACSTMNARPFMLSAPPGGKPEDPTPPPLPPGQQRREERGLPPANTRDTREGSLMPGLTPSKT
jgi:TonB family protein